MMALEVLLLQRCFGGPWDRWSTQRHLQPSLQKAEASKRVQMGVTENLSRESKLQGTKHHNTLENRL